METLKVLAATVSARRVAFDKIIEVPGRRAPQGIR